MSLRRSGTVAAGRVAIAGYHANAHPRVPAKRPFRQAVRGQTD
jgi:hypothetical protein